MVYRKGAILTAILFCGAGLCFPASSQDAPQGIQVQQDASKVATLADLDLEQLANIRVTSASKKEEKLAGAPAAIFVITAEDIRRGGFSSLPDVLRMVPGMTIQQMNSHAWTVSTRGFNGFPNEKMLVLIDGRAVYDPLYGGVNWDVQDLVLEDVERIEVIRGPGGALWGANAVNGVINIITKKAGDTQGLLLATSLGQNDGHSGSVRFGGTLGSRFAYRAYARSSFWDAFADPSGSELFNNWNLSSSGFRSDWQISPSNNLILDASGYQGHIRDTALVATYTTSGTVFDAFTVSGGHLLANWTHKFTPGSSTRLSGYCDWTNRTDLMYAGEYRNTCDLELQHDYEISRHHAVIWGGGYRTTADQTRSTIGNYFTPPNRRLNLLSAFGQYELKLIPDRLRIIAGSKFEHNTYTGFDLQPQVRAVWMPAKGHTIWGAISRSVRTPTRNEHDHFLLSPFAMGPGNIPILILFTGNARVRSEHQNAYELGYRYERTQIALDVSAFYNSYSHLLTPDFDHMALSFNPDPPYFLARVPFINLLDAQTRGLEASVRYHPFRRWLLIAGVTEDRGIGFSMSCTPRHEATVQSRLDLPSNFAFDSALYYMNHIKAFFGGQPISVPTRNRVDLGLSWRGYGKLNGLSLGVWGRSITDELAREGQSIFVAQGNVRRAIVVKMSWDLRFETKTTQ